MNMEGRRRTRFFVLPMTWERRHLCRRIPTSCATDASSRQRCRRSQDESCLTSAQCDAGLCPGGGTT